MPTKKKKETKKVNSNNVNGMVTWGVDPVIKKRFHIKCMEKSTPENKVTMRSEIINFMKSYK